MFRQILSKLPAFPIFIIIALQACAAPPPVATPPPPSSDTPTASAARLELRSPLAAPSGRPYGVIAFAYELNNQYRIGTINLETGQFTSLTEPKNWGDGDPSWFADGSRIIFTGTRDRAQEIDIYTMRADGTEIRPLASARSQNQDRGSNFSPIVSPDGTKVVFHTNRDGNMEIYLADLEGNTAARNLTRHPSNDVTPSWTPDGRGIIFSSDRNNGVYQIYIMDLDGQNLRQFRSQPEFWNFRPKFSPNGQRILFGVELYLGGDHQIAIVNVDGSDYRVVSQGIRQCAQGEWVGDDYIVCSGRQNEDEKWGLYLISLADLKAEKISPTLDANFRNPSWSGRR